MALHVYKAGLKGLVVVADTDEEAKLLMQAWAQMALSNPEVTKSEVEFNAAAWEFLEMGDQTMHKEFEH